MKTYPYYIANRPLQPNADLEVRDKYSGEVAARVAYGDAAAIDSTIAAAIGSVQVNVVASLVPLPEQFTTTVTIRPVMVNTALATVGALLKPPQVGA